MNRTLILLLAVLLLGGAAWFVTNQDTPKKVADRAEDRQFSYAETDDVQRIFIADRQNNQVTLTRDRGDKWLVDGQYPANEVVMKNLLRAVSDLDIQSLPTYKAVPNLVSDLATRGILVQLFDEDDNKLRGYYIGGANSEETGVAAIMENSENPYLVHIPGFTGNVRYRFNLRGDDWRSKVILATDPDEVDLLQIEYPTNQAASFKLEKQGGNYLLSPLTVTNIPPRSIPRGVAEGILERYEKFYASRYENNDRKSIAEAKNTLPFASIKLVSGDHTQTLSIYPRYRNEVVAEKAGTRELQDVEAYRGFANNGADWVLLSPNTTEPLLVSHASF